MIKKTLAIIVVTGLIFNSCTPLTRAVKTSEALSTNADGAKNVVLMIVDGMGFEHVKAARIYNGQKRFNYENFPCQSKVTTCSYAGVDSHGHCSKDSDDVTDSAAAATAIATGKKVKNGEISRHASHESDIETILELAQKQGKATGIVATKLFTDATPAAFVSHADDRDMTEDILNDMFHGSQPNVIFGADTMQHRAIAKDSKAGYRMVHTVQELKNVAAEIATSKPCSKNTCPHVYGGFGQHGMIPGTYENKSGLPLEITPSSTFSKLQVPHLSDMTDAALKILNQSESGFFLMVESSMPDMISHYNAQIDETEKSPKAIAVLIREMLEVENTIRVIENFMAKNPNTLLVLTADHETGGLVIDEGKTTCLGQDNCIPSVRWTSEKYEPKKESPARHTAANVPLYAKGQGAERFCRDVIDNTDISHLAFARGK